MHVFSNVSLSFAPLFFLCLFVRGVLFIFAHVWVLFMNVCVSECARCDPANLNGTSVYFVQFNVFWMGIVCCCCCFCCHHCALCIRIVYMVKRMLSDFFVGAATSITLTWFCSIHRLKVHCVSIWYSIAIEKKRFSQ